MFQNLSKYIIVLLVSAIVCTIVALITLSSSSFSYFAMNNDTKSNTEVKLYFDKLEAEYPAFVKDLTINDETSSSSGIYKVEDEYTNKTGLSSLYYRGSVNNNWFYYEKMYWRIVRINGAGNIKLIYYGDTEPTELDSIARTDNSIYATLINEFDDLSVVDEVELISYANTCEKDSIDYKSSNLEVFLNQWYEEKLLDSTGIVENSIYYNDRAYEAEDESNGHYAGYTRMNELKPSLLTLDYKDSYTSSTLYGNGELSHPIGVLTADEYVLAGDGYLNENVSSWTMTPANIENDCATMFINENEINNQPANQYAGVRPVIVIDGSLEIIGSGLYNDPYRYN